MLLRTKNFNKNSIKYFCKYACEVGKLPRTISLQKDIWKSSSSIRSSFINYFEKFDHKLIAPCSVRAIDGSYFVNSGVCQFKNHILGNDSMFSNVSRAVNSQRCIRLGGKMCDLENIGYDSTHLSYFEMLGNWSFRMYDKATACKLMWEYLTICLQLPSSHLYVTYFGGCEELGLPSDEETRDIWFNLGVKDNKILQFGLKDNFWEMGDRIINPICGPCTEIHWDYLATIDNSNEPRCARCFVNSGSPELVELWNCVFMQYRWTENGSKLVKLPGLVVDTGMGLERLTSAIQGVTDIYSTDNFSQIIDHISTVSNAPKYQGTFSLDSNNPRSPKIRVDNNKDSSAIFGVQLRQDTAYRIIADHLRTLCVAIYDGILPGRQFVELKIRHLLRRAIRQSKYGLGMECGLSPVIDTVCDGLQGQIEFNSKMRDSIKRIVETEEKNFLPKLEKYEIAFQNFLNQRPFNEQFINETEVKLLMDGYFGEEINLDIIRAMAKDAGFQINAILGTISEPKVLHKLKKAKSVSLEEYLTNNNIPATNSSYIYNYSYNDSNKLYETEEIDTEVLAIIYSSDNIGHFITEIKPINNSNVFGLVTSSTNMFPFKGGQASDKGVVVLDDKVIANIDNVIETDGGHVVHWCEFVNSDFLPLNQFTKIKLRVDAHHRTGTTLHHTAHHILFEGINNFLGKVYQTSSSIKFNEGKFGFSIDISKGDVTVLGDPNFISNLENFCNNIIKKTIPIKIQKDVEYSSILQDIKVRYFDANRLPNKVRVVSIGETGEVCCGTHAYNSGHLEEFLITSFSKVKQAISYIEFVSGQCAKDIRRKEDDYLKLCCDHNIESYWINGNIDDILYKLNTILCTEKLSKIIKDQIQQRIDKLKKLKRISPSLSIILNHNLIDFKDNQEKAFIVETNLFGVKKAVEVLNEMNLSFPVMIHNDSKVLIHLPKSNVCDFMPDLLRNIDKSVNDYISEIPQVKNLDPNVLSQYLLLTFENKIQNIIQLKKNFEDITTKF